MKSRIFCMTEKAKFTDTPKYKDSLRANKFDEDI